jgi:hypothetical protein
MTLEDHPVEHRQRPYDAVRMHILEQRHGQPPLQRGEVSSHPTRRDAAQPAGFGRPQHPTTSPQPRRFGCGRRLRYVLVRNPGGVPRRMRTGLAVVPLLAIAVVVVAMAALNTANHDTVRPTDTPVETSDDAAASPGGPPYFGPAPGWETSQAGFVATAANVPLRPDALEGNFPAYETIGRLEEGWGAAPSGVLPDGREHGGGHDFPAPRTPALERRGIPHVGVRGAAGPYLCRAARESRSTAGTSTCSSSTEAGIRQQCRQCGLNRPSRPGRRPKRNLNVL